MNKRLRQFALSGLFASASLAMAAVVAQAAPVTVADQYWGGNPVGVGNQDVIGNNPPFGITSATFDRITTTNPNDTLVITINTAFAGAAGTGPALGAGYGSLFLNTSGAYNPIGGGAPQYASDIHVAGDWAYAFLMPAQPGSGSIGPTASLLYAVQEAGVLQSQSFFSNGFRSNQAVQYSPQVGQAALATGTWAVNALLGTITFSILDNLALGSQLAIHWAMTCANDVIEVTAGGFGADSPVPLPPALILFLSALGGMVVLARRRRQGDARLALNSAAA